ncbi:transcript variant X2 [Nothobranchius furzeri]|uniref:Transcript variant X2 n=2 Tax=Nothobranchius furzeri TaxID=105023 RepID=A0A9D2Z2U0_NOTFU|nr:transcript variant X2 [Nothobranchius furzeri]
MYLQSADHLKFTGHVGENVTLAFPLPSSVVDSVSLKRRNSPKFVFYYRDGHKTHRGDQDPQFIDRVISSCQPTNNTVLVTLLNVTKNDSGEYTVRVTSGGDNYRENMTLIITDAEHFGAVGVTVMEMMEKILVVFAVVVVLVVVVVMRRRIGGYVSKLFTRRACRPEDPHRQGPSVYQRVSGSNPTV